MLIFNGADPPTAAQLSARVLADKGLVPSVVEYCKFRVKGCTSPRLSC